jgi:2-polyprenyl-6-methoxyphenol hydroxylase-like FAD-dependent oxidoreductase
MRVSGFANVVASLDPSKEAMDYDVVIAGAGPVGLLLACELRLAGVSVLVLEKLEDPNLPIKTGAIGGRALNIPSIEVFYRRALLPALKKAALWWTDLLYRCLHVPDQFVGP